MLTLVTTVLTSDEPQILQMVALHEWQNSNMDEHEKHTFGRSVGS